MGFGVAEEPLVAAIAARGAQVLATDMAPEKAQAAGWSQTGQHARALEDLNRRNLCPVALFDDLVRFQVVDMTDLDLEPEAFDFVWSSCALEHLGSIEAGRAFVLNSLKLLRLGGVAVHTTEYNLANGRHTLDEGGTVLFRRRDLQPLIARARRLGMNVRVNWFGGGGVLDHHIDAPPYTTDEHLKLEIGKYQATSLGLLFENAHTSRR